ncbi:hypothetical protein Tco_0834502 [Tanacetum coccineum]
MHTVEDLEEPVHQEFVTGDTKDKPDEETSQLPDWFQNPAKPPTPDRNWNKTLTAAHGPVQPWLSTLALKEDTHESFNELMDTPLDFSAFSLVELEYFFEEVYKATTDQLDWNNPEGRQVIPFDHFTNNDLAYLSGGVSSQTYTTSVTKTKAVDYGHIKWIEDLGRKRQQFYGFAANRESAWDVYSKHRIIAVTKLQIVEWHKSIVIQRRAEDLQLGVESYQKKLTLTKPDTYRSDLKQREAYTAYSNPRGFIYQNKDKKNKLTFINELHKFSDGTLNDVRTTLNDRLKGIWMKYLPQTIWRQSDRDKAGAMI